MKFCKSFALIILFGFFFVSCEDQKTYNNNVNQESITSEPNSIDKNLLVGSWKDQSPAALHFSLLEDGTARSDNMATLLYQSWRIDGDDLILVAKSVGNGTSILDTTNYKIEKLDKEEMILKQNDKTNTFLKQ